MAFFGKRIRRAALDHCSFGRLLHGDFCLGLVHVGHPCANARSRRLRACSGLYIASYKPHSFIQDRQLGMDTTCLNHEPSFVQNPDAQQLLQLIFWQTFTG